MMVYKMLHNPQTISELATRVLKHPIGGVQALLALTNNDEREWLELKAAAYPEGGIPDVGLALGDYEWNIAKAVVALANSNGGVVLLGMNDNGKPIGLGASDPSDVRGRKGAEAFRRSVIMQKILNPARGWRTGKYGTFKLCNPQLLERLVNLEEIRCNHKPVLAIIVAPTPKDFGYLEVENHIDDRPIERMVFARKRGAIGEVFKLETNDQAVLAVHEGQRQRQQQEIETTWKKFLRRGVLARSEDKLEENIRNYLTTVTDQLSEFGKQFTPLWVERLSNPPQKTIQKKMANVPGLGDEWLQKNVKPRKQNSDSTSSAKGDDKSTPTEATKLFQHQSRAILVGDAGSGKSACFAKAAMDAAKTWLPGSTWPLFVSLAEYDGHLGSLLQEKSGIDWEDLYQQIAKGKAVLYLDALNECPDLLFDNCSKEISGILAECSEAHIFVSMRSSTNSEHFGLPTFRLKPMDPSQQRSFLKVFFNEGDKAQRILKKFHSQPGSLALTSSPIILRIIAEIARTTDDIPSGRAQIYKWFFSSWYSREKEKADISGTTLNWSHDLTLQALSEFAFQFRRKGIVNTNSHSVRVLLARILGDDVDRFIDWASQGLILSRNTGTNSVKFWHETIQEYFCAEYLVSRDNDIRKEILERSAESKSGSWAMPIAFAFELIKMPSKELINAAWAVEPLITAAAARCDWCFVPPRYEGDAWTRGVLRALLGKDCIKEAREISIQARLPPKYPISPYLLSTLRSHSFWYTIQTHDSGLAKRERLTNLFKSRHFPWIELLSDAIEGYSPIIETLSPAMRAVIGCPPVPRNSEILLTANASELCALRRKEIIKSNEFLTRWARSLKHSTEEQLELDLIDILRSEKDQIRKLIPEMMKLYKPQLQKISQDKHLSLRLLRNLVRDGVLNAKNIRNDADWLKTIITKMSPINAIRLVDENVIFASDLGSQDRTRLLHEVWFNPQIKETRRMGYLRDLFARRLLSEKDISLKLAESLANSPKESFRSKNRQNKNYRFVSYELSDASSRQKYEKELKEKRWKVAVKNTHPEKNFGFAQHPCFDKDLHFRISDIRSSGVELSSGQTLDVLICPVFNGAKQEWGFAITQGHLVK